MKDLSKIPVTKFTEDFRALAYIYMWRHEPKLATREKKHGGPFSQEEWRLLTVYTN